MDRRLTEHDAAALAQAALAHVRSGQVVGLGSGQAATAFVRALGREVKAGLEVRAVPTSEAVAGLAGRLGIPLVSLDEAPVIDVTLDGADEVDPHLDLIKGYGGALVREKVVAAASRRLVILVGREKLVPVLGSRGQLPVEVVPFAAGFCRRRVAALGCAPVLRSTGPAPVLSDNGNRTLRRPRAGGPRRRGRPRDDPDAAGRRGAPGRTRRMTATARPAARRPILGLDRGPFSSTVAMPDGPG